MTDLDAVAEELSAFADDDEDVVIENNGNFLIVRGGQDVSGRLIDDGRGGIQVAVDGTEISYRSFITHRLARLDVLAERIIAKRAAPSVFIDGEGLLNTPVGKTTNLLASKALQLVCSEGSPFSTRVAFVTADAGHGKTVLLREVQHRTARRYLDGGSSFLFWHVDLQGRQLVRLSEALMGDLGDLRVSGLWMPAVLRLMRMRALVLAIDGFDELAAEQGSTDALGALATMVRQLDGKGVVIAASRRTFFDTEDYLARAQLIHRSVTSACQFDQLTLKPWGKPEAVNLFKKVAASARKTVDASALYREILTELGDDDGHPMLTRPFLLNQLARAIVEFEHDLPSFIREMDDPHKGVAAMVQAFVEREVKDKWVHRETGERYLSVDQHMELLARVAEEMYETQKDRLKLDVIEMIATILLEQWGIEPERRVQVASMVRMHVLLTRPADGESNVRSFDHSEFRDYFVACALRKHLEAVVDDGTMEPLASMLRIAQLTDSTAKYVCGMLDLQGKRSLVLAKRLAKLCRDESRVSFVAINIGTLLPFVLHARIDVEERVEIDAPAVFSSLVFERTRLVNLWLKGCTFLNTSLVGINWIDVCLTRCTLGELTVDVKANISNVSLEECEIGGLRILQDDGEVVREYAPSRIDSALVEAGFTLKDGRPSRSLLEQVPDSPNAKLVRKLLRLFQRTTIINESGLQQRFRQDFNAIVNDILPQLETHSIVETRVWHGGGRKAAWTLVVPLDELLAAEESGVGGGLSEFWQAVKSV